MTVALPATTDCTASGAICGANGKKLSTGVSGTVQGPPALSVADARAEEGADATLDFEVTLGRAPTGTVTVDYATADGTATAGDDYTATSGTLAFAPGETAKTVSVPVLDDSHDEGSETMRLTLSNAQEATIEDGEAVGTIVNDDPIPQAWLARFGRTVTGQVLDAVEARLAAPRAAGAEPSLAGLPLPSWTGGSAAANAGPAAGTDEEARAGLAAMTAWLAQSGPDGRGTAAFGARDEDRGREPETRGLTGHDLLTGSSFTLTGGSAGGAGFASLWSRGALASFHGRQGSLAVDGEVATGLLGTDFASERWTAGLAVGHSRGSGGYATGATCDVNCAGRIEATLTGLYPYAGVDLADRLSVWAAAGHGAGELRVAPEGKAAMTADLAMSMGAAGLHGEVLRPEDGAGLSLAVKGDARLTRTSSDSTSGMEAADADVWLVRTGIEGSRPVSLGRDGPTLTPSFELGLRLDGGDAETGMGADMGGGLSFADPKHGVSFESRARAWWRTSRRASGSGARAYPPPGTHGPRRTAAFPCRSSRAGAPRPQGAWTRCSAARRSPGLRPMTTRTASRPRAGSTPSSVTGSAHPAPGAS